MDLTAPLLRPARRSAADEYRDMRVITVSGTASRAVYDVAAGPRYHRCRRRNNRSRSYWSCRSSIIAQSQLQYAPALRARSADLTSPVGISRTALLTLSLYAPGGEELIRWRPIHLSAETCDYDRDRRTRSSIMSTYRAGELACWRAPISLYPGATRCLSKRRHKRSYTCARRAWSSMEPLYSKISQNIVISIWQWPSKSTLAGSIYVFQRTMIVS